MGLPGYDESGAAPVEHDGREPCPYCRGRVRIGARKCPHCKEYLDRALADDRRAQIEEQVNYIVESESLIAKVKNYVGVSAVGSFIFFFLGPIAGPAMLGYALYYQHRARLLQMPELPRIRLLFAFAGLWTMTGIIGIAAFIFAVNR